MVILSVIIITTIYFLEILFRDKNIIKGYEKKEEKYSVNGMDSAEYTKYYYTDNDDKKILENANYEIVTAEDIENIQSYFENFKKWFSASEKVYDFDINVIKEGDAFSIKTLEGKAIGQTFYQKYDNYTIYYYDRNTHILYYLHDQI